MHESLLTKEEAACAVMRGDFAIVPMQRNAKGEEIFEYESDKAERMTEDQVLRLIESIFEGAGK